MTELMRAAGLSGFRNFALDIGLQPEALLSRVGIDRRALDDPEMRISAVSFAELLELAARESGIDTIGLRMAEPRNASIVGAVGMLLREEPTVRHALHSLITYISVHNDALAFQLDEVDGQAVVAIELRLARPRAYRQGIELTVAVLFRFLHPMMSGDWQPIVCFTHEPPGRLDVHHRIFGGRVDFRCNYNGIIFRASELSRPIAGANPVYAEHARRYLQSLRERSGPTLEDKVRTLISAQLSSGRCTVELLSRQLGCDRRTLHRRLAAEQTTFDAILNSVRRELAVRLLQNRNANLAAAADLLGFSSASAFSRWFVTDFGKRPSDWRKDLETAP